MAQGLLSDTYREAHVRLIHFSILETMVRNRLFVYQYSAAIH